jgi:hypothetical protein
LIYSDPDPDRDHDPDPDPDRDHDPDPDPDRDRDPDPDPDRDRDHDHDPDRDHDPDPDRDPDRDRDRDHDHDPDRDRDPDRDHDPDLDPDPNPIIAVFIYSPFRRLSFSASSSASSWLKFSSQITGRPYLRICNSPVAASAPTSYSGTLGTRSSPCSNAALVSISCLRREGLS